MPLFPRLYPCPLLGGYLFQYVYIGLTLVPFFFLYHLLFLFSASLFTLYPNLLLCIPFPYFGILTSSAVSLSSFLCLCSLFPVLLSCSCFHNFCFPLFFQRAHISQFYFPFPIVVPSSLSFSCIYFSLSVLSLDRLYHFLICEFATSPLSFFIFLLLDWFL